RLQFLLFDLQAAAEPNPQFYCQYKFALQFGFPTICYLGYYQLGINGKELARYFGMSRPSVSQAIKRGEKIVKFAKENDFKLLN
ncbi:MAG: hypothetical protein U9Q89_04975, partial [Thermodesulfobacteriota bacterium]|nr:hypothetical protein [Thermodesulfobacteriota bacterium]